MISDSLQPRDWEILRTLCRLRYVTTQEIISTFFASPSVGRRRLRRLSALDLIAAHRKGVPEGLVYSAWRLTSRGVDVVTESFPDEPIPDGLAERLPDASLYNLDHRAALGRLYRALVTRGAAVPDEADMATMRSVVHTMRSRADGLWWQPDGDVVLHFKRLAKDAQIVPDATVCARLQPVRVFVELDRSTRGLARIDETLQRYAWLFEHAYPTLFPDGRTPLLLYVVRSDGRRSGIEQLAARRLTSVGWAVRQETEAVPWLEEHLGLPVDASAAAHSKATDSIHALAKSLYVWARAYDEQLRAEGRALPEEGRELLRELHREIQDRRAG